MPLDHVAKSVMVINENSLISLSTDILHKEYKRIYYYGVKKLSTSLAVKHQKIIQST